MVKKILAILGLSSAVLLGGLALKGQTPPPNYIDYKLAYVTRNDNSYITEIGVQFFEGSFQTVDESNFKTGSTTKATRYVRTKRFDKSELAVSATQKTRINRASQQIIVYTDNDFGQATSTAQLQVFLDKELAKNVSKLPLTKVIIDQNINEKAI